MSDQRDPKDVETRLWKEIEKGRFGMLGLVGERAQHFQPMTAFVEPEFGKIWFFTYKDTDLARAVEDGSRAMFVVQAKDQDLQACVAGQLSVDHDPERMDRFWSPHVAAWYPEGKDDPRLTMLRFDAGDAQVWLNEAGPIKYAFEVAKANATHQTPDVGDRTSLNLG